MAFSFFLTFQDHPLNKLRVVIEPGVDPDDTYNETPYEKGFACVSYLQMLAGSTQKFDDFLKAYVAKFQFKVGHCCDKIKINILFSLVLTVLHRSFRNLKK